MSEKSLEIDLYFRSFYDRDLNSEQRKAVKKILSGSSRPAPYLVFGPPGTGKTVTLVEAIKQVRIFFGMHGFLVIICSPTKLIYKEQLHHPHFKERLP